MRYERSRLGVQDLLWAPQCSAPCTLLSDIFLHDEGMQYFSTGLQKSTQSDTYATTHDKGGVCNSRYCRSGLLAKAKSNHAGILASPLCP